MGGGIYSLLKAMCRAGLIFTLKIISYFRRPDYIRSVSMPQPWDHPHYEDSRNRGWSEPLPRSASEATSEFSYVTFDAQTITVPISVCISILVGYGFYFSLTEWVSIWIVRRLNLTCWDVAQYIRFEYGEP